MECSGCLGMQPPLCRWQSPLGSQLPLGPQPPRFIQIAAGDALDRSRRLDHSRPPFRASKYSGCLRLPAASLDRSQPPWITTTTRTATTARTAAAVWMVASWICSAPFAWIATNAAVLSELQLLGLPPSLAWLAAAARIAAAARTKADYLDAAAALD